MAIQLGTVAPIGFPEFDSPDWLACFRAMGCTLVQAYRNQQIDLPVQRMLDYIAAGQMRCESLHGVFGAEYDPSSPIETVRRFSVNAYRDEGELALRLSGPLVVVHCSSLPDDEDDESPADHKRRLGQLRKSIVELGRHGEGIGVTYAFENLPGYHPLGADAAELADLLRDLAVPSTGMCFDTGHALMVGDPAAAIRASAEQIVCLHLSDNSSRADEHEMPTFGALDCDGSADAVRDVGYGGSMVLEVFHTVARLREMLDDGIADRLAALVARASGVRPAKPPHSKSASRRERGGR